MRALLLVAIGAIGCGAVAAQDVDDATMTDAPATDAAAEEGIDVARPDSTFDVGPTCGPITSPMPIGVHMVGAVTFDDATRSVDVGVTMIFPHGRIAGASVFLVMSTAFRPDLGVASGVLDASLGAHVRVRDPFCQDEVDAMLVGPADGLAAAVTLNFSAPSDALSLHHGRAKLCSVGPVSGESGTLAVTSRLSPAGAVRFKTTASDPVPIDSASASSVRAFADGVSVPLVTGVVHGLLEVEPAEAYGVAPRRCETGLPRRAAEVILRADVGLGTPHDGEFSPHVVSRA
jgi:hypothetical protein